MPTQTAKDNKIFLKYMMLFLYIFGIKNMKRNAKVMSINYNKITKY